MIYLYTGPMVSLMALMHGLRVDWRWDAPGLAKFCGQPVPRVPPPYLDEWLMKHPTITNREVLHPKH